MAYPLRRATLVQLGAQLLVCTLGIGQQAQDHEPGPASVPAPLQATAPAVRSARLTLLTGSVQVQRSNNTGEDQAVINMPLPAGTRIATADYSQAEIEFEDGSVARLTPRTSLALDSLALDSGVARTGISVLTGLAYFELRKAASTVYEVQAGGGTASPLENLTLRVNLDQPAAVFAVLAGTAEVRHAEAFKAVVHMGETLRLDAADDSRYFLSTRLDDESWDRWNQDRDQAAAAEADQRTAARDHFAGSQGYGWSDLDAHGTWYDLGGQGRVWQPSEAVADPAQTAEADSFDPYGYGAWVWSGGGYLFASGYSWGWTPYRCGTWAFYPGFGWAWAPNAGCGQWGFAGGDGGGVLIYGSAGTPPRRRPVPQPVAGSGVAGPPVMVHPPRGSHPPRPHPVGEPVHIAGATALPLRPIIGTLLHAEHRGGQALDRDFPFDSRTHQPALGVTPGTLALQKASPASAPGVQAVVPATRPTVRPARPEPGPSVRSGNPPVASRSNWSTPPAPAAATYAHPTATPGLPPAHTAPPPAPAPVTHPAQPAAPPAPPHIETAAKPKP